MTYSAFIANLKAAAGKRTDIVMEQCGILHYNSGAEKQDYPYYKIYSKNIGSNDQILLIRATIHGNEPAGSFTILNYLDEIAEYAHARGIKLIIFPMDNPSGYERGQRYNMENDAGSGNNDFIRYELADGSIVDDIGTSKEWKGWRWTSDPALHIHLPKETAMLHTELKRLPLAQVRAVLDLHQDNYIIVPGAYAYAFGDTARYETIVNKIGRLTQVFKNEHVDSGYLNGPSFSAEAMKDGVAVPDQFDPVTDRFGCIERHDCTLPDLFFHLGAEHCITVETTTKNTPEVCDRVNMIWVEGLIDLITKKLEIRN